MSGLEVVAAVSAVISAFHGGSELLKHVKKKRRARKARDLAQQEWEEEQLQSSLVAGEQQIDLRYKQDLRELGDFMRVGDGPARDRLFHIALVLQAEIIKSLQMAATNDFCVLNLRLLHEASITNRNETFVTLDELKQRIYVTRPMTRQLRGSFEGSRPHQARGSVQTMRSSNYSPISSMPDDYVPSAVSLPSQGSPRHALTEYYRANGSESAFAMSPPARNPARAAGTNLSSALEELIRARGGDDPAAIMQDIEEIIGNYKGLNINNHPAEPRRPDQYGGGQPARRDTLAMLHGPTPSGTNTQGQPHDLEHMFNRQPPIPAEYRSPVSELAASNQNTFDTQQYLYHQQHAATNQYTQMQMPLSQPRWSDVSASSSAPSDAPSLNRNSSNSSQGSNPQSTPFSSYTAHLDQSRHPLMSASPQAPYHSHDQDRRDLSANSTPNATPEDRYTPSPIAPLAPLRTISQASALSGASPINGAAANVSTTSRRETISPLHKPWPGTQHSESPPIAPYTPPQQYTLPLTEDTMHATTSSQPRHHLTPQVARSETSMYSNNSDHTITPTGFAAVAAAASNLGSTTTASRLRHASITPSIASTDSSGSNSIGVLPGHRIRPNIRSDTIQSGPTGQEKMMNGRPNKDNDYWGFCKGAWAVRESTKKGIEVRTQPLGYYNTRQIWGCKSCNFTGDVYTKPHPTRKNKTVETVDPHVKTSMSGIRYRWIFLAKSHVKKKSGDSSPDDNYGCVLCSAEGNVTGVYGGVETLMNHIALTHVADMSEMTRKKVNCVLGRVAGQSEEFDINVPIFDPVEELAG